jgi:hypothetical protein
MRTTSAGHSLSSPAGLGTAEAAAPRTTDLLLKKDERFPVCHRTSLSGEEAIYGFEQGLRIASPFNRHSARLL